MSDHERNFRTHFYEKVSFRGADEKNSIEILLKEQPIRKEKLVQFCLKFGVPAVFRIYVWKILLGILPANQSCQDYVWKHRVEQVRELERSTIFLAPESIDRSLEYKMLRMKLIEEGTLPLQEKFVETDPLNQYYLSITRAVSGFISSDDDLFWISTRFFRHISQKVYGQLAQFPEYTLACLKKEDQDQRLYTHLCHHQVITALPLLEWFHICFANVLPESSLERIWDRILGDSSQILIYVAVAILLVLRRPLLAMQSTQDMLNYLKQVPEDCGDRIVNEAIDLLHKNGGQFPIKSDFASGGSESGLTSATSKPGLIRSRHGSVDSSQGSDKKTGNKETIRKSPHSYDKIG